MTILRIFKYALKNIFRNTFLTFTSLLVLTLLMFFINLLVLVHSVSFSLIYDINQKLTFSLYVKDEYSKTSVEMLDFLKDVKDQLPGVQVQYYTQDQVYADVVDRMPGFASILEKNNPLPETIQISNIDLDQYEKLNNIVQRKLSLFDENESEDYSVSNYTSQYEVIERVTNGLTQVRYGVYVFLGVFILSIIVIVYVIIGNFIFYYRDEIHITRLVGGSKKFIYGPFSIQGMIYTGSAYLMALGIFYVFLNNITFLFDKNYSGEIFLTSLENIFLLSAFPVFLFIGAVAGWLSSRKYLR